MKTISGYSILLTGWLLALSVAGYAQNPEKHIRQGNQFYEEQDFTRAETSYLKALESDSTHIKGLYNRADALYEQEEYGEAAKIFNSLTERDISKRDLAATWHNLGNSMVKAQDYQKAVEAYKNALRNNPGDRDTKYNLTYALEKLKEQEQQQEQQNEDNQDKDKDQQEKDDQQKKDQDQKQDQDKDEKQERNDQQKEQQDKQEEHKQQPQPEKISRKDAERMLEALKNNEKETMKDLKRIKAKGEKTTSEKDW